MLCYVDFSNYLVSHIILDNLSFHQRKKFLHDVKKYFCDEPCLFRRCADDIIRSCVLKVEMLNILHACNSSPIGGHHVSYRTTKKILQSEYYWPTIYTNAYEFFRTCVQCLQQGLISKNHEILMTKMLEVVLFDVWGIDFMKPFVNSYNHKCILVDVDYESKWV